MSELFLFDTICDDIIGEILQYIKWCNSYSREKGDKDPYMIDYHRLLWIDQPIITYTYSKWKDYAFDYVLGGWQSCMRCEGELISCDLHYKTGCKRAIKKDTKGLISYTYERGKFKEIAM